MSNARIAGPYVTAGALSALLISALIGQLGTSSSAAAQPKPAPAAPASAARARSAADNEDPPANLDSVRLLRKAGLTDAAVAELRRWIKQNPAAPVPADIQSLVAELADTSLALAKAYLKVGLKEQAQASLLIWIQQHPNDDVPADLVPLLVPSIDESLRVVRANRSAHQLDAAVTELQQWVKDHPDQAVPEDLRELLPTGVERWWWWLRKWVLPVTVPVLAGLSLLIVLVLLLIRAFGLLPSQIVIEDFETTGTDAGLGKRLSVRLRQRIAEPNTATPSLRIASGAVVPDAIPADIASDLGSTAPLIKFAASALRWIQPSRLVNVSGVLHPTGPRGVGLTLIAAEGKSVSGSVTIWQQEFEPDFVRITPAVGEEAKTPSVAYDVLLPPAATWLRAHIRREYGKSEPGGNLETDWQALALFDAGLRASQQKDREDAARALYLGALNRDPHNLDAQLNLALLLPATETREKIRQLEAVAKASKLSPRQTTFYSAAFSLAMLLFDDQRPTEAAMVAGELVAEIDRTLAALMKPTREQPGDEANALKAYLQLIGPSARVIAAAIRNEELPESLETEWPSVEFQYNLACYYSLRGDEPSLLRAIEHLEFAAALDRVRVVEFARAEANSVLTKVATSATTRDRFATLVARSEDEGPTAPSTPPSLLGAIDVIGQKRAEALAAQQIQAPADLLVACCELLKANALAASVSVELATVLRWARAAELMRLTSISAEQVNALVAAGYDSLASLRGIAPATVRAVFKDWGKAETPPPADTLVDAWAMEAMTMSSLVATAPAR